MITLFLNLINSNLASRQQKWKSAFKNPSGKLALKVGSSIPESKNRYVQNFKGHSDGVWHVCTAKIGNCNILASASAGYFCIFCGYNLKSLKCYILLLKEWSNFNHAL